MSIENIIYENGIKLKHFQEGNQKVKCPQCQPPHNPRDNPLSVTIKHDGVVWKCHHCEWTGGKSTGYIHRPYVKPVYEKPKEPVVKQDQFMFDFFKKRGISETTIKKYKIINENKWIAFQYFDHDGTLTNIKYRTPDKHFRQSANAKSILYNFDRVCNE